MYKIAALLRTLSRKLAEPADPDPAARDPIEAMSVRERADLPVYHPLVDTATKRLSSRVDGQ